MVSKKLPAVVVTTVLLAGVLLAPSAAQAQRGGRGGGGGGNGAGMGRGAANSRPAVARQAPGLHGSVILWPGHQWPSNHNHFVGRPFFKPFVRPFFPFAIAPSVVYAAPYYYPPYYDYPPPAYYDPPQTYYAPPASTYYAPAPATSYNPPPSGTVSVAPAPPPDNVIQYSHGRYELRGDGVSTPYRWGWIPHPPPPPARPRRRPSATRRRASHRPETHRLGVRWRRVRAGSIAGPTRRASCTGQIGSRGGPQNDPGEPRESPP